MSAASENDRSTAGEIPAAPALSAAELRRYSRQLILPGFGVDGQRRLKAGSVLCVGAGGLGSPVLLYLAAAGVGRIGIVEPDTVAASNLQRQVVFGTADAGRPKAEAAADRLRGLNPEVEVAVWPVGLTAANAEGMAREFDVIVDATDNFPARYLCSDTAVRLGKPCVYGSVFRFEGQVSVFAPHLGAPCYRCLFPVPPDPASVPSCADGGVLGVLPGLVGMIQATEVLKLLSGAGEVLTGRMLHVDAARMRFREFRLRRDPECPACGDRPRLSGRIDYEEFCGLQREEDPGPQAVTPGEFRRWMETARAEMTVLDVREAWERALFPFEADLHVPWNEVSAKADGIPRDRRIVVVCRLGVRSGQAAAVLREAGFRDVFHLAGGLELLD